MKNCRDARLGAGDVLLALVMLLTAGCTGPDPAGRPTVAVSVLPQAWFVERLAEERVEVEVMVPPGASPVTYEPTVEQMRAMSRAIVYVKVGHPSFSFEAAWLDDLLAARPGVRVVDGSAGVTAREGDPHVWLSPPAARAMARGLAEALTGALPEAAGEIRARLEALEAEIDAVERDLEARLGPLRGGRFYVFHPAWGYLARDYGLSQVAIEEGGREPSPRRLQEILERARADGVEIILVQPQFSRQHVEALADDLGARLELADPLAGDWATNLREVAVLLAEAVVVPAEVAAMPVEALVMPVEALVMPVEALVMPVEAVVMPVEAVVMPVEAVVVPAEASSCRRKRRRAGGECHGVDLLAGRPRHEGPGMSAPACGPGREDSRGGFRHEGPVREPPA